MNLQDAREERAQLNNRIQQALDDFTANTGLTVSSIDLDTVVVFGSSQSRKYIINTEVRL